MGQHQGLIPDLCAGTVRKYFLGLMSFKTGAIATGQNTGTKALEVQRLSKSDDAGCFASPAHTKITHKNDGYGELLLMQQTYLKTPFTNQNNEAVDE